MWDYKHKTSNTVRQINLMQKYKNNRNYIDKIEIRNVSKGKRK